MCGRYFLIDVLEHEGVVLHHPLREHKMGTVGLQPGDGLFHALQRVAVVALALGGDIVITLTPCPSSHLTMARASVSSGSSPSIAMIKQSCRTASSLCGSFLIAIPLN